MTTVSDLLGSPPSGTTWILDRERTTVRFQCKTLWGAVWVKGTFGDVDGAGEITQAVSGHLSIGVASMSTGIGKRDEHLRSPDFFDADAFPAITVDVTNASVTGRDTVTLDSTLTIKDVARSLELPATVARLDGGAWQVATTAEIDRKDFGVDGNMLGMVGDTAKIVGTAVFTPRVPNPS